MVAQQYQQAPNRPAPLPPSEALSRLLYQRFAIVFLPEFQAGLISLHALFASPNVLTLSPKCRQRGLEHQGGIMYRICSMLAVLGDQLAVSMDRILPRDAKVKVVVFGGIQRSIENAHGLK